MYRNIRPEVFYKKGILRNFSKFTRKHQCHSPIFNTVAGLRSAALLKMEFCHGCFPVNFNPCLPGWFKLTSPFGFLKNISSTERVEPCFFVAFHIILKHSFPENFIEFPQVVQKIWRKSLSILAMFINFPQYFGFFDITLLQRKMMSAFFHFQHNLNRLLNNCIKLYWY